MTRRSTSLGPHDVFLLDEWGRQLHAAFGTYPYLVGSVARADDFWRDVDVRLAIPDDVWPTFAEPPARLRSLNLALTLWGRQVTALPIDFQFQSETEFAAETGIANPLGPRSRASWNVSKPKGASA